jgi:multicomponent Na+:H+ antiporter subunit D
MLLGVLGAVSMKSVRRILSIHIVSQIGYMALGIGLMTELAIAGAIFFILHNMVVKSALFLCGGMMQTFCGTDELNGMGGLIRRAPWLATFFFVAALSLAGLPPLSGFFGKWMLLKSAIETHHYLLAFIGFFTSLLTLMSMLKIWNAAFWSEPKNAVSSDEPRSLTGGMLATGLLLVVVLSMGFGASLYYRMCTAAARGVLQPEAYIQAVLPEAK